MNLMDAQRAGNGLRAAVLSLFVLTLVVVSIYFYKFGGINSVLSNKSTEWGVFGDYLSGALGSIFSFAAFIGVLWSIRLQVQQLQLLKGQIAIEEMQRLVSYSSQKIDDLLHQGFFEGFKDPRFNGKQTLFDCIAAAGTLKMQLESSSYIPREGDAYILSQFESSSSGLINRLNIEFNSLSWAIEKHQARGGDKEVFGYYVQKYIFLLYWLHKLGRLEEASSTHKLFGFAFSGVEKSMR